MPHLPLAKRGIIGPRVADAGDLAMPVLLMVVAGAGDNGSPRGRCKGIMLPLKEKHCKMPFHLLAPGFNDLIIIYLCFRNFYGILWLDYSSKTPKKASVVTTNRRSCESLIKPYMNSLVTSFLHQYYLPSNPRFSAMDAILSKNVFLI